MKFTAHELMFMWDAVAAYAARPEFDDLPECERMFETIGTKCSEELERLGWTLSHHAEVHLPQR